MKSELKSRLSRSVRAKLLLRKKIMRLLKTQNRAAANTIETLNKLKSPQLIEQTSANKKNKALTNHSREKEKSLVVMKMMK